MRIENSFEVAAPVEEVWRYLLDVEKVVPCMPGAELTETVDDDNWKGKLNFKLGPVSLSFAGSVTMAERDEAARRIVLTGKGMEQRGKGAASATVTSTLSPAGAGTRVDVVQDVTIQGQAAQMARGMMQDVSERLTKQFADCLQARIGAGGGTAAGAPPGRRTTGQSASSERGDPTAPAPVAARPVNGLALVAGAAARAGARVLIRALEALVRALRRFVER